MVFILHSNKLLLHIFFSFLPFRWGNNGGWNWLPNDARCDGRNNGGVPRGALLSSIGRKPFVLWKKTQNIRFIVFLIIYVIESIAKSTL